LGGATAGSADIDLFFKHLSPIIVDPRTEISNKPGPSPIMSIGRADRHLRDAIRKSYKVIWQLAHSDYGSMNVILLLIWFSKVVKEEITSRDQFGVGFIEPDALYAILVKRCIPLTFQDFRFLTQQVFIDFITYCMIKRSVLCVKSWNR
jgi:hypothetical protein